MRKVDAILSYNETEHAVIVSHNLKEDNIYRCPWVIDAKGHGVPFSERSGIAFLGGYRHQPNVEAVEWFVATVMPLLRKRAPHIKFYIYGSHAPESFGELGTDAVVIKGFAETLDEIFETCRVFVAPLRSGAGIKGKVLDSMSYGVPAVLSPIAAEATGLANGVTTFVAEDPEEWAEHIVRLHEDETTWRQFSANILTLAAVNYSFEAGVKQMRKVFEGIGVYPSKHPAALVRA
jgi:hypothetical protein